MGLFWPAARMRSGLPPSRSSVAVEPRSSSGAAPTALARARTARLGRFVRPGIMWHGDERYSSAFPCHEIGEGVCRLGIRQVSALGGYAVLEDAGVGAGAQHRYVVVALEREDPSAGEESHCPRRQDAGVRRVADGVPRAREAEADGVDHVMRGGERLYGDARDLDASPGENALKGRHARYLRASAVPVLARSSPSNFLHHTPTPLT